MRFDQWIRASGLKQKFVAHQLGVSENIVCRWKQVAADPERLTAERPSFDRIVQIAILSSGKCGSYDWCTDEERLALGLEPLADAPPPVPTQLAAVIAHSRRATPRPRQAHRQTAR